MSTLKTFVKSWAHGLSGILKPFTRRVTVIEDRILIAAIFQLVLLFMLITGVVLFLAVPLQQETGLLKNDVFFFTITLFLGGLGYYLVSRRVVSRLEQEIHNHTQFLSDASHELRTPLTIMKTNLEIALRHPEKVDCTKAMVDTLQEVNRMQKIIEDLLLLSRNYLTDPAKQEPAVTDLHNLLEEITQKIQPYGKTKNVEVMYEVSQLERLAHYWVKGERIKLSEAFLNLIRNAIDYSKPQGGFVRVKLTPSHGTKVAISVTDNGIGISPDHQQRVFNRFFQANKPKAIADSMGSGLGLPITKSIVEKFGGTIELKSQLGKGTTFTVMLERALNQE